MSGAKRMLERQQDMRAWAEGLLVQTKALGECPHGYLLSRGDDEAVDDAVERARAQPYEGTAAEESEGLVRSAMDDHGEECPAEDCPGPDYADDEPDEE